MSRILGPAATLAVAAAAFVLPCRAAGAADWLDSPAAREFRDRVVMLALIHGDSSGLDPQGFLIRTRMVGKAQDDCADVEVVTLQGEREIRREILHACRRPGQHG